MRQGRMRKGQEVQERGNNHCKIGNIKKGTIRKMEKKKGGEMNALFKMRI